MALSKAKWIVLESLVVIFFSLVAAVLFTMGCGALGVDETWVLWDYELGEPFSVNSRVLGVIWVIVGIVVEVIALESTINHPPYVILFGLSLVLILLLFKGTDGSVFSIEAGAIAAVIGAFYLLFRKKF